jgi:hypothetical protein
MKKSIIITATVLFGAAALYAQNSEESGPVSLGFKVGVPVTSMFDTGNVSFTGSAANTAPFTSAVPKYEFGVSGEFRLPKHLSFEVDGLFKRGGFDSALPFGSGMAYQPTTFNNWEIPGLFKYHLREGRYRPFIDFGASLRHISTIQQFTYAPVAVSPSLDDNSIALHNRNSFGGVAGIGITFKKGPVAISPEARYTRWANSAFEYGGFKTNLDQGDVLLGLTF